MSAKFPRPKRYSAIELVLAAASIVVATGWFVVAKRAHQGQHLAQATARVEGAARLLAAHEAFEAKRLSGVAEMLAGDQRIRQTVLEALDEPTLVDTFNDMQGVDRNSLHAVLDPK